MLSSQWLWLLCEYIYYYIHIYMIYICIYIYITYMFNQQQWLWLPASRLSSRTPAIDWFWLRGWLTNKGAICTRTAPLFGIFISLFQIPRTRLVWKIDSQNQSHPQSRSNCTLFCMGVQFVPRDLLHIPTLERFASFEWKSFPEKNPCHHCSELWTRI